MPTICKMRLTELSMQSWVCLKKQTSHVAREYSLCVHGTEPGSVHQIPAHSSKSPSERERMTPSYHELMVCNNRPYKLDSNMGLCA